MIWHNSTENDVISELRTDPEKGLTAAEAEARIKSYGKNEFRDADRKGLASYILKELKMFSNIALIVVALVYLVLTLAMNISGKLEAAVIIVALLSGIVVSALFKYKSDIELEKLHNSIGSYVTVIRDGAELSIHASELVPGDIMVLKTGDYIKADGRLIDSYALACEEFRITGDAAPSEKRHDTLFEDITPLPDRHNMVYCGSAVLNGRGLAVVTETAANTEVGMRADMERQVDTSETVLCSKLNKIKRTASSAAIICATAIFFIGIIANFSATNVSFAITVTGNLLLALSVFTALGLGIIPSLLTFARACTAYRLKKNGIMVTDAKITEELKDITAICTDKTGALTTEQHTVVKIFNGNKTIDLKERACDEASVALLRLALICSNFSHDEHAERHTNNMERAIEAACIEHAGMSKTDIDGLFPKIAELPFDSERMLMTTVTAINGNTVAIIKGAPEVVSARCTNIDTDQIDKISKEYAKEGLKVIAVAIKPLSEIPANPNSDELENQLTFVGILGIEDGIDRVAVALCRECATSGIKTVMVTGDHFDTAVAVGIKAGIISDEAEAISGEQLSEIDDAQLAEVIDKYSVFARITPEDKQRIVAAFKARGEKVLVTGDSINDTQALLEADFGCALGRTASDMVKDCADLVVKDNKFSSIVLALKESARIFIAVKKALAYLFTAQLSLLAVVVFGLIIYGVSPITASAAVFLSIIALALPLFAIFTEDSKSNISLSVKGNRIFDRAFVVRFAVPTVFISVMALIAFGITLSAGAAAACASAFGVFAFSQLIHAICISHSKIVISKRFLSQKTMPILCAVAFAVFLIVLVTPIGQLLSMSLLSGSGWIISICSMIGIFIIDEALKLLDVFLFN